jgi:hypothetical protein
VKLAAPLNFAACVQGYGLGFHPLRGDVQQIITGDTGRNLEKGRANSIRAMLAFPKSSVRSAIQLAEDALEACQEAGTLISLTIFAPFGKKIAENKGISSINIEPTPLRPASTFPAAGWSVQYDLGDLHNRFSGKAMLQMIWGW